MSSFAIGPHILTILKTTGLAIGIVTVLGYPFGIVINGFLDRIWGWLEEHTPQLLKRLLQPFNRVIRFLVFAPYPRLTAAEGKTVEILADMFLDDDQALLVDSHARRLFDLRKEISLAHIQALFWRDVFPIFILNLLVPAGQWGGWQNGYAIGLVERRRRNSFAMVWRCVYVPTLWATLGWSMEDWQSVVKRYKELENKTDRDIKVGPL
jgi:hypothetical protein